MAVYAVGSNTQAGYAQQSGTAQSAAKYNAQQNSATEKAAEKAAEKSAEKTANASAAQAEKSDKFEGTSPTTVNTYQKPTWNGKTASMGNSPSALNIKNELVKNYVQNTLKGEQFTPGSSLGLSAYNAAEATSKGLSEFEYWGSDATSERIFTFAKTLAGGDLATLDKMEAAFNKGYNSAVGQIAKGTGKSKLPEATTNTYDKVTQKFADYRKELQEKAAQSAGDTNKTSDTAKTEDKPQYAWQTEDWRKEKTGVANYTPADSTAAGSGAAASDED
ncbi:hypothetical protein FACS1894120_0930 [Clostridia bacterium]|nr:hypothetical protein FACS1894120_0930 [Clostridia bacterium]